MSKAVALVGFSKRSNKMAHELPEGVELWTLNHAHMHGFPHIERLYDMHPFELIQDPHFYTKEYQQGHLEFLKSEHDYPVYMLERNEEIPASVRYPLEAALELAGEYLHFTSSFCYMAASAIIEGYDKWYVLGFDMDQGAEYEYQREEALKWLAFAEGKGIDVYLPETSGLFTKRMLYGYEGIPMINRALIEIHMKQYERQEQKALDEMNQWQGILAERKRSAQARRLIEEATLKILECDRRAARNEGAVKAMKFLLDTSDLKEVYPTIDDDNPALIPAEEIEA